MAANPRTWPIFDGRVQADGIDLVPSEVFPSELFWRQLKFGDFDIAEMSMSTLMMAVAAGDERWIGIPVFTTRKMFHTEILVRRDEQAGAAGEEPRHHDRRRRDRRHRALHREPEPRRSQPPRPRARAERAAALRRSARRGCSLLQEDRAPAHQPRHGREALARR